MNKPSKIVVGIIVVVLLAALWLGISQTKKQAATEPIRVGVIIGLTGSFAPYGEMVKDGAQLAIQELNRKVGTDKYALLLEDSQSAPDKAVSAYRSIQGQADAFLTGQSSVALALVPLANQDKIVELNVSALTPKLRGAGAYVFSMINDSTIEVGDMAEHMYADGIAKAAVLYQNDDAGSSAKDVFVTAFQARNGTVADMEPFDMRATDFRTQLLKIKQSGAQAVYLPAYPESVGQILKQANAIGLKVHWYAWNVEGPQLPEIAGELADGLVYTTTNFDASSTDPISKNFTDAFAATFGVVPNIYAATAYDGIKLIADADTGKGGDAIRSSFESSTGWNGVSGTTKFDSDHMVKKAVIFKTIKNGKFVNL